ncbi:MAG: 3-phosphoshikimate 1-carboxyvinyltransferase [Chloroflexi bacterium]|nr:3-phosphoshikimate 1-carboxyvinyltransferase [Chloroflexota bacterium]
MEELIRSPHSLYGQLASPGDKSISHRAAILNSLAKGSARVTNLVLGADVQATLNCLQALGVTMELDTSQEAPLLNITGVGTGGLHEAGDVLNAANSGTTLRLLTGLLAAQPFLSFVSGDSSLRSRPMARLIHPLRLMGAEIWGRGGDSLAPLAIRGKRLQGIEYSLPVASAQLKSAILLAALFAEGSTTIIEPAPSRDHTERLLATMGATIEISGSLITLSPNSVPLTCLDIQVPGDISAAAYWLVAGTVHPNAQIQILNTGVNPTRTGVIDVLRAMGARIDMENQHFVGGEPVADLSVESSSLKGVEIRGPLIPRAIDELPIVALAACFAQGQTVIRDAGELRVKESDRIQTTIIELSRLGAKVEELPDGMIIYGGTPLKGATCSSHRDHRLAMTLGIAGLVAEGETVIQNAQVVAVSYPSFWRDLKSLAHD